MMVIRSYRIVDIACRSRTFFRSIDIFVVYNNIQIIRLLWQYYYRLVDIVSKSKPFFVQSIYFNSLFNIHYYRIVSLVCGF